MKLTRPLGNGANSMLIPNRILLRCDEDKQAPHAGHNCRWTLEIVDPLGTTVGRLASGVDDTREEGFAAGQFLASVFGLKQIGGTSEGGYEFVADCIDGPAGHRLWRQTLRLHEPSPI